MRWILLAMLCGCRPTAGETLPPTVQKQTEAPATAPQAEATSLLGEPLHAPALPDDVLADREAKLATARSAFEASPDDLEAIVWLGRRVAYLGRYRESVEVYTDGLKKHPDAPELYRHRGHRYITLRRFDDAVADLTRAAELIEGKPDVIEQDGLPNAAGVPTGTRRTNVFYHLGLAHFLRGEFETALAAYKSCLKASTTDDMRVATSHWLYMTLRRLERDDEALAVLKPIRAKGMTIHENHAYHRLLLMYRGDVDPTELIAGDADAIESSTLGFGLGNWHLVAGRTEKAHAAFEAVVKTDNWAAFGFIAAEAELAALQQ